MNLNMYFSYYYILAIRGTRILSDACASILQMSNEYNFLIVYLLVYVVFTISPTWKA